MRGSVILEKINDRELRQKWEFKLVKLAKAIKELNDAKLAAKDDPTGMQYFEAVLRFADARDEERTQFWQSFVAERVEDTETKKTVADLAAE